MREIIGVIMVLISGICVILGTVSPLTYLLTFEVGYLLIEDDPKNRNKKEG